MYSIKPSSGATYPDEGFLINNPYHNRGQRDIPGTSPMLGTILPKSVMTMSTGERLSRE
jgi:hypothetical protein